MEEELVERAQLLQGCCVGRDAALEAGQQLVHIAQHLLHIQVGIFVLRQAGNGLQ